MTEDHQELEASWWGDCGNTYGEEFKQLVYAEKMGLHAQNVDGKWPVYDLAGKSVLDIGGGPVSMLLKTVNGGHRTVVDPCPYPVWIADRYEAAGIEYVRQIGETYESDTHFDECWIYNVLQHVEDPEDIIATAKKHADVLRVFEWIDIPPHPGHPHELRYETLNEWLETKGRADQIAQNFALGRAYFAVVDFRPRFL